MAGITTLDRSYLQAEVTQIEQIGQPLLHPQLVLKNLGNGIDRDLGIKTASSPAVAAELSILVKSCLKSSF